MQERGCVHSVPSLPYRTTCAAKSTSWLPFILKKSQKFGLLRGNVGIYLKFRTLHDPTPHVPNTTALISALIPSGPAGRFNHGVT